MKNLMFIFLFLVACQDIESKHSVSNFAFTEIESGIEPTVCGSDDPTQILEVNGTGLGLFDYDNDGDLDLFVVNAASLDDFSSGVGCTLYENQSHDTTIAFLNVTEQAGINVFRWANGVAIGDVNDDGFEDIYITCFGPNVLLTNNGDGTFEDSTDVAGVGDERWGTSAAFGDLDQDGDLDLYVCNYLEFDVHNPPPRAEYKGVQVLGGPHGMTPEMDVVYMNHGDGTFQDVTEAWQLNATAAFSLNVVILDVNGDGKQDVYVGNDSMANNLFINKSIEKTTFEDVALVTGASANGDGSMQATMGIAVADVDRSGTPDFFTTNFSSDTNTLHVNNDGYFEDRTKLFGLGLLSRSLLGWSCGFHDFDLDGDEDLLIVNGHVYPEASAQSMDSDRSQPMLWMSRVGDRFKKVSAKQEQKTFRDRAAVFGDIDGDGDTDVIVAERNGPVRVLRNDAIGRKPLVIHLEGDAIGASLKITLDDGTIISRWNHSGGGFQSSSSTNPTFTFPEGSTPTKLDITWGNGDTQRIDEFPISGALTIVHPDRN
jgi:hypothetical protein